MPEDIVKQSTTVGCAELSIFVGSEPHDAVIAEKIVSVPFDDITSLVTSRMFSPFVFANNHRKKEFFDRTNLLVLDIDKGMSLFEAEGVISEHGLKAILGTTKRHTEEQNRFRIFLPLSETIRDERTYQLTWQSAKHLFPHCDDACKDVARFYFPCKEIVGRYEGIPFNVSKPAIGVVAEKKIEWKARSEKPKGTLYLSTIQFVADPPKEGEWHRAFIKAAFDLKQNKYTFAEARAFLSKATGHLDDTDEKQLLDVYENRTVKPPYYGPTRQTQLEPTPSKKFARSQKTEKRSRVAASIDAQTARIQNSVPFMCDAFNNRFRLSSGVTFIAGPTGRGKSTASANIIAEIIDKTTKDVLVAVNEETEDQVLARVACIRLGLNFVAFHQRTMVKERFDAVIAEIEKIEDRIEVVDRNAGWNTNSLEDMVRLLQNIEADDNGFGAVVIDYLQAMSESEDETKEKFQISKDFGKFLIGYSQRSKVPLVVFAQINSKSKSPEFGERVQNDKTFVNNVTVAIEMVTNIEEKTTKFVFHKDRFGDMAGQEVICYFDKGRFCATKPVQ